MSKYLLIFLTLLIIAPIFFIPTTQISAFQATNICDRRINSVEFDNLALTNATIPITITFNDTYAENWHYFIDVNGSRSNGQYQLPVRGGTNSFDIGMPSVSGTYDVKLKYRTDTDSTEKDACSQPLGSITVYDEAIRQARCSLSMPTNIQNGQTFNINVQADDVNSVNYLLYVYPTTNIPTPDQVLDSVPTLPGPIVDGVSVTPGSFSFPANPILTNGDYVAVVRAQRWEGTLTGRTYYRFCSNIPFTVTNNPSTNPITVTPAPTAAAPRAPGPAVPSGGEFCDGAKTQIKTALGCLPVQPKPFIEALMKFIAGAAGGIALLLIISGGFQIMTSQGNPESLKKGQEQLTSALIGLLFIIFSVLLLQIIGADILNIPGFGR